MAIINDAVYHGELYRVDLEPAVFLNELKVVLGVWV
jgi:hypothetical protein